MCLPNDIMKGLKVVGAALTGVGSILLAWRVYEILKWVVYCLVTHEDSINKLRDFANNTRNKPVIVGGVTTHLIDVESKGYILLIVGFLLLGVGMLCNMITYLFGAA